MPELGCRGAGRGGALGGLGRARRVPTTSDVVGGGKGGKKRPTTEQIRTATHRGASLGRVSNINRAATATETAETETPFGDARTHYPAHTIHAGGGSDAACSTANESERHQQSPYAHACAHAANCLAPNAYASQAKSWRTCTITIGCSIVWDIRLPSRGSSAAPSRLFYGSSAAPSAVGGDQYRCPLCQWQLVHLPRPLPRPYPREPPPLPRCFLLAC